ncbi:MAG: VCBS repeat-containing protein [Bacteroidota bacterium]|nr:VCBS repeat-containing protein [Bacteroidota bacterium]
MFFHNAHLRLSFLFLLLLIVSVSRSQKTPTLFRLLPSTQTGVAFKNTITENDKLNILNEAYIYNGGGVGIGDFNNDGLPDIYFAGNMVSNKLYLNKGSLKFQDITATAGVSGEGKWCTGVSVVDINADGWLDIYVCATFLKDPGKRTNLLYINQGNNKQGIPTFKESAKSYGIADDGYSTQGVFFDYDNDGDLDLYVLTNTLDDPKTPIQFRPKVTDGTALNTDRLYRNNGNGTFTNVSREAGILIEGWGHAVSISDINLDGWPDIYVSSDFNANDIFYINNGDGTFTDHITDYFKHTSWYTMGTDVVDINNDGFVDVIALDMLPETNLRKKGMLMGNEYYNYFNARKFNYQHQYVRNVLQLNSGPTPLGHPIFSDVGYMAGIYQTDWSWAPLVADFDNDGFRDIVITNGLPRDVTDLDYISYDNGQGKGVVNTSLKMVDALPVVKVPNYAFKNTGGFVFANATNTWGLNQPSFSNGGAYADLDNDGDLDLVINNINEQSFVYENTLNNGPQKNNLHYLSIVLVGTDKNPRGTGTSLHLYYDGNKQQYYEHQPCRGYLSTVDPKAHFGLGATTVIDSLRVRWPDGKSQLLTHIKADQIIKISYQDAVEKTSSTTQSLQTALLEEAANRYGINFKHQEKDAVDYNIQPTLPHKLSQYGPGIAVGDVDNNGYEDFYIGGSAGNRGVFFMQDANGHFSIDSNRIVQEDNARTEEMGVLLFDADNDKDLDLYVVSGSYEFAPNHPGNQDRLYLNNGEGKFYWDRSALPKETTNGSCVRAADFDQDGDFDLFVGGRSVSGAYPTAPKNFILRNEGGKFIDVTQQYCPQLQNLGMITDALWTDFDQDGKLDLVLTGEWMPVTFLKNTGTTFTPVSTGIDKYVGWWNSLVAGDFDNDGDIDYVAGNLGLNSNFKASTTEPMILYAKDLNDDGKLDPMIFCYIKAEDGTRKPFPMHTKDDLSSQLISIRKTYPTYKSFGRASIDELWSKQDRENALTLQANHLATSYIENKGNGQFALKPLPLEAQVAPVYGMLSEDVDGDGNLDLLLAGNDYGMEPGGGRHDAFTGLCLKGNGKGNFTPMTISESGFFVKGDAKGLAAVHTAKDEELLLATQNQDSLLVFSKKAGPANSAQKWITLNPDDFCADILYKDNKRRRIEFYYGSTFLSQSSRKLPMDKDAIKVVITDFRGNKREVINN